VSLLVDAAIRSSIIVFLGLVATMLLRHRSAALRHVVLAAAIFGAAAVLPLSLVVPAWDVPWQVATSVSTAAMPPESLPAMPTVVTGAEMASEPVAALPLIAVVWMTGVMAGTAVFIAGIARVLRIASRAERLQDGAWARVAAQLSRRYGLTRRVVLLQTDAADLLATWGLFRPCVLLPAQARAWSEDRAHVVLCHELAHIRRGDWFVQISAEALRTIYWFNPLLWIACRRLQRDSEQACDDVVLETGVSALEYATHLLELARSCHRSESAWASVMPMARPSTLERRIAAMLNPGLNRVTLSRRVIALTAVLLASVTLPTAAFRATQSGPMSLSGSVYDASGAVLPGVELTLEDALQVRWQATSDAAGHFQFPSIQPGRYVLEASLMGFRSLRHEFELRQARDWDRAVTLQVGDVQETITVRASRNNAVQPPAVAPRPAPIRVGGNIRPPNKLYDVKPVYPQAMRDAGREGVVPIEAIIGREGDVVSVRVLSAQVHPDFAMAAIDAVRQWRYSPTLLNGLPVEVVMTVSVTFSLSE
jgi:TonB family protein